jgi:cytochrome c-type biogenesis protein CcmH/NrfG
MIELGYPLQRLDRVEQAIKAYLEIHPADVEFLYALAGCNFSQGKYSEAADGVSMILIFNPQHTHALELHSMIVEKTQQGQTSAGAR